jgi:MFS family permease
VRVRDRLGALAERDFRLLFSATMITTAGDRLGAIALTFAVLDLHGAGPSELGIVLAARLVVQAVVLVFGGVLSDRLPRSLVLVGASLVQGGAQAVTAALVLAGDPSVISLAAAQAVYGLGDGLVLPAEIGLIPQTVSPARLQQANALQGLSRNLVGVLGPAIGGVIVVAGSPGIALAIDAASFLICGALLARIHVPARASDQPRTGYLSDLREGWREFSSRTWLWTSVVFFGIGNMVSSGAWGVLGPTIAKADLGGAGAWATILTLGGVGAVLGGLVAFRVKPERPLYGACLAALPALLPLLGLALHAPLWVLAALSFLSAISVAIHLTLWFTVFQQQVPERAQSRVSSYDALGSFVLIPVGLAAVGPVAASIGTTTTLWGSLAIKAACFGVIISLPSVRAIRSVGAQDEPVPTLLPDQV